MTSQGDSSSNQNNREDNSDEKRNLENKKLEESKSGWAPIRNHKIYFEFWFCKFP